MASRSVDESASSSPAERGLSPFHLYGLRVVFLLMALFLLGTVGPLLASPPPTMMTGAARALLVALGLMAALGVRYPVQMVPIMLFELTWKLLWLFFIGLPLWSTGQLDPPNMETFYNVAIGIPLVLIVLPYRHVFEHYVRRPSDSWRFKRSQ